MKNLSHTAVIAAVTAALTASAAFAADTAKPASEHCFGVAKAGKNDCMGNGNAACAGHAAKDGQGFLIVPAGTCERLVGGSLTDPSEKK